VLELLRERGAVVGPTVPLEAAADSLRWARTARARLPESVLARAPVLCDRQLPALLLLGDEALVNLIGARRLAPLADLTAKQRDRLESTLLAWLDTNRGSAPQVAVRLGVHPQTARNRLHRVQELFGAALADPEARFEMEVALRGRLMSATFGDFLPPQ
jgi:DNA-binding PucR family transcriptional regulator